MAPAPAARPPNAAGAVIGGGVGAQVVQALVKGVQVGRHVQVQVVATLEEAEWIQANSSLRAEDATAVKLVKMDRPWLDDIQAETILQSDETEP